MSVRAWVAGLLEPRDGLGRGGLGPRGERAAARHLRRAGYRVLARNVRVPVGEADLVCLAPDRRTLVIVEVKSREAGAGPAPEAGVTAHKKRKLRAVALSVARRARLTDAPVRIDVVGVDFDRGRVASLRHHVGAVTA